MSCRNLFQWRPFVVDLRWMILQILRWSAGVSGRSPFTPWLLKSGLVSTQSSRCAAMCTHCTKRQDLTGAVKVEGHIKG